MYEMSCQSRFDARYWMLGAGALGRPRGMEWGGRREEGSGWGTHVYLWRIHFDIWKNHSFVYMDLCRKSDVSDFNILSRFVIVFFPRSRHLLILWLQSPSAVILEPSISYLHSCNSQSCYIHLSEKCWFFFLNFILFLNFT